MDDFLDYTFPFTMDNLKNIQQRFDKKKDEPIPLKPVKRKKTYYYVIVACLILLTLTAYTYASNLKILYYQLFGDQADKILADSDKLTESMTDQGFQLKALSSFRDQETTYILVELTNLIGDRLTEKTSIWDWRMNGGGNAKVINYEPKTKTATILVSAINTFDGGANEYLFSLHSFLPEPVKREETLNINLESYLNTTSTWLPFSVENGFGGGSEEKLLKKHGVKFEDLLTKHLKPEEKTTVLSEQQEVFLSNIGYKDDFLHVQIKYPNDMNHGYYGLSLIDKKMESKKHQW